MNQKKMHTIAWEANDYRIKEIAFSLDIMKY